MNLQAPTGRHPSALKIGSYVSTVVILGAVYFCAAKFGLSWAFGPKSISAVWPPTGIALAALLLLGSRVWPGIWLGAFLANLRIPDVTVAAAAVIAIGNTLEAVVGAYLLRRVGHFQCAMARLRDVLSLVILATLMSTIISATVGVLSLSIADSQSYPGSRFGSNWVLWWTGDAMGNLIVAPVLLALFTKRDRPEATDGQKPRQRAVECALFFAIHLTVCVLVFASPWMAATPNYQQRFIVFPLILWAALRLGQRVAALAVLAATAIAIVGVTHHGSALESASLNERILLTQAYLAVLALTSLVLGAVARERQEAMAALQKREVALKDQAQRKDEFLAILAHELRNPLAAMRNAIQLIRMPNPKADIARRASDIIDRQIKHTVRLVDDLLDVSRISHGKILLRVERIDLVKFVGTVAEEQSADMATCELSFTTGLPKGPIWVEADPTRLTQIIGNLLLNARKFTPAGGRVTLEVGEISEAKLATVTVRDTGIGMEEEMLQRLFEPFFQADRSLDRSMGGLGLGLALAKGLIELHGGRISASSRGKGLGSEFQLSLPLLEEKTEPALPAGPASSSPLAAVARMKVLIIEDNVDAAEALRLLLEIQGRDVRIVHDGPSGLAVARTFKPDVILCDIGLPRGMSGYDFAEQFRRDKAASPAFLIAMSGYGQSEDKRRAFEAGFALHLTKPVDPTELEHTLSGVLPHAG